MILGKIQTKHIHACVEKRHARLLGNIQPETFALRQVPIDLLAKTLEVPWVAQQEIEQVAERSRSSVTAGKDGKLTVDGDQRRIRLDLLASFLIHKVVEEVVMGGAAGHPRFDGLDPQSFNLGPVPVSIGYPLEVRDSPGYVGGPSDVPVHP